MILYIWLDGEFFSSNFYTSMKWALDDGKGSYF